jgi:hypothetical protein
MSTKKKDKKRGDKGKKDKKDGIEPIIEVIDPESKKFYLKQVLDLEEKLERFGFRFFFIDLKIAEITDSEPVNEFFNKQFDLSR